MQRLIIILSTLLFANYSWGITLRVDITPSCEPISICSNSEIFDLGTHREIRYSGVIDPIEIVGEEIRLGNLGLFSGPIFIRSSLLIKVNNSPYRGDIEISKIDGRIKVINVIDLEDYLYGVIKKEVPGSFPFEAIKAQAVVSRTFALANLGKHGDFDLCSNCHCQMYGGVLAEDIWTIIAVRETQGEILVYNGKIADTPYHSTCGGHTDSSELVWSGKKDIPYLRGVRCGFCYDSPHYTWQEEIPINEISKALNIGNIYSIEILEVTPYGRVQRLLITHSKGETKISGRDLREILGLDVIKSTRFTCRRHGDMILFSGYGFGHGVGMCQFGAKEMAKAGYTYKEILEHYYPGTELSHIEGICH
ncbi:MAG: SpoIID/LytB domain-containing protein [bacterium]|nr:SpoIID/LytB domain-containing protein [bacterium]